MDRDKFGYIVSMLKIREILEINLITQSLIGARQIQN